MRTADDTPMSVTKLPKVIGEGQTRKCRSFDALFQWMQSSNSFSCCNRTHDWGLKDRPEAYALFPENSLLNSTRQAYFEKWGHASA